MVALAKFTDIIIRFWSMSLIFWLSNCILKTCNLAVVTNMAKNEPKRLRETEKLLALSVQRVESCTCSFAQMGQNVQFALIINNFKSGLNKKLIVKRTHWDKNIEANRKTIQLLNNHFDPSLWNMNFKCFAVILKTLYVHVMYQIVHNLS